MASSKGARVEDLWEALRLEGGWDFRLDRPFNECEMEEVQSFLRAKFVRTCFKIQEGTC